MKKFFLCALFACVSLVGMKASESGTIFLFSKGIVAFEENADLVDSVALEANETQLTLFSKNKTVLFSAPVASIDSITFSYQKPVADILDVVFSTDGTAKDISPLANTVQEVNAGGLTTYYNSTFKRFVARFTNAYSGTATGYYKVDYTDNTTFRSALSDGHTLEMVFMANYDGTIPDSEAKIFSSHQSGGTGFLISKTNTSGRKNEITFLPNVNTASSSNWIWANSGVVPVSKVYYHVVGVWSQEEGKAYVYVNGEQKNSVAAVGNFRFPNSGCNWFGIGGDPSSSEVANTCLPGDVVIARVYDKPLTKLEVSALWYDIKKLEDNPVEDMVSDVSFTSNLMVKGGIPYNINGVGFAEGDCIQLVLQSDTAQKTVLKAMLDGNSAIHIVIPEGFEGGAFRVNLIRGNQIQDLGTTTLVVPASYPRATKVIAHRGYWDVNGAAQNSRESLQNSLDHKFYGSETDVWLTTDDSIVVNHDATLKGVKLQTSSYEQCKNLALSNGETIPRLREFLKMLKNSSSPTKLIIEIKSHSTAARNTEAAQKTVALVKEMGVEDKVEYISFSLDACRGVVATNPQAIVAYLTGDLSPATLNGYGIKGLDYTLVSYALYPTWVSEAHALGMTTNVWTVNERDAIIGANNADHDFITTNNPVEAQVIYEYYQKLNQ